MTDDSDGLSLATVHADLVARLETDRRLRVVEQAAASQDATLKAMLTESAAERFDQREAMRAMESRLTTAIDQMRPEKPWAAVSAVVAFVALILVASQALYR